MPLGPGVGEEALWEQEADFAWVPLFGPAAVAHDRRRQWCCVRAVAARPASEATSRGVTWVQARPRLAGPGGQRVLTLVRYCAAVMLICCVSGAAGSGSDLTCAHLRVGSTQAPRIDGAESCSSQEAPTTGPPRAGARPHAPMRPHLSPARSPTPPAWAWLAAGAAAVPAAPAAAAPAAAAPAAAGTPSMSANGATCTSPAPRRPQL